MFDLVWTITAQATFDQFQQAAQQSLQNRRKHKSVKPSKAEGLFKQIAKAISLLAENPRHPSLQTHEFHSLEHPYSKDERVFEAYAQNQTPSAYRIFWCYGPARRHITIIAITPHP